MHEGELYLNRIQISRAGELLLKLKDEVKTFPNIAKIPGMFCYDLEAIFIVMTQSHFGEALNCLSEADSNPHATLKTIHDLLQEYGLTALCGLYSTTSLDGTERRWISYYENIGDKFHTINLEFGLNRQIYLDMEVPGMKLFFTQYSDHSGMIRENIAHYCPWPYMITQDNRMLAGNPVYQGYGVWKQEDKDKTLIIKTPLFWEEGMKVEVTIKFADQDSRVFVGTAKKTYWK